MKARRFVFAAVLATLVGPTPVAGQPRAAPAVELSAGWIGIVDDRTIHGAVVGGGLHVPASRRVRVGPEVVYAIGPDGMRDLFVTGTAFIDVIAPGATARRATPYVLGGAGYLRQRRELPGGSFHSSEGTFTAGGGLRVRLGDRLYIAPEVRFGWELHTRVAATVGLPF